MFYEGIDPQTVHRLVTAGSVYQAEALLDELCVARDGAQMDGHDDVAEDIQARINSLVKDLRLLRSM